MMDELLLPSFSSSASIWSRLDLQVRSFKERILFFFVSNMCTILPVSRDQTSTTEFDPATSKFEDNRAAGVRRCVVEFNFRTGKEKRIAPRKCLGVFGIVHVNHKANLCEDD